LELNRAKSLPTPLPVDNPLPDDLILWSRESGVSLQLLPPVQRRVKNLEEVLEARIKALLALIAQQQHVSRVWTTSGAVLGVLLLFLACILLSAPFHLLSNPAFLLSELPSTALWACKVLLFVVIFFVPLLYLLTRRESAARSVPRQEIRLSLLLAELLVLVALPLIFQGRVNPYELMLGLVFAVVAEVVASVLERNRDLDGLRKREAYFRDKLKEVQISLKGIADTTAFVSERDKEAAALPPPPAPGPAT